MVIGTDFGRYTGTAAIINFEMQGPFGFEVISRKVNTLAIANTAKGHCGAMGIAFAGSCAGPDVRHFNGFIRVDAFAGVPVFLHNKAARETVAIICRDDIADPAAAL